jgi:hypothetical protein
MSSSESLSFRFDKIFFNCIVPEIFPEWIEERTIDFNWSTAFDESMSVLKQSEKLSLLPSPQEKVDDVPTNSLRLILLPYMLG